MTLTYQERRQRMREHVLCRHVRWTASRKLQLVLALHAGIVSETEAVEACGLAVHELKSWRALFDRLGPDGLRLVKRNGGSRAA